MTFTSTCKGLYSPQLYNIVRTRGDINTDPMFKLQVCFLFRKSIYSVFIPIGQCGFDRLTLYAFLDISFTLTETQKEKENSC